MNTNASAPYAIVLTVGAGAEPIPGVTHRDLTPEQDTPEAVLAALADSGLTPADLRSRALLQATGSVQGAVMVYAALCGFAGRYLDISDGSRIVTSDLIAEAARRWESGPKPAEQILLAQIGREHPQLRSVGVSGSLTPDEVAVVSYARRLRFVASEDTLNSLMQLIAIAAIRRRGVDDRLPHLVFGDEPVSGAVKEALNEGIDLDALRRAGQELRRRDLPQRNATVAPIEPNERMQRLEQAARAEISQVMIRLGGRLNSETGLWHCPRPDRHTNGDANASMKVADGRTRCFRCDAERVDSLRLVIDTLGCSVDEAADWILTPAAAQTAS